MATLACGRSPRRDFLWPVLLVSGGVSQSKVWRPQSRHKIHRRNYVMLRNAALDEMLAHHAIRDHAIPDWLTWMLAVSKHRWLLQDEAISIHPMTFSGADVPQAVGL